MARISVVTPFKLNDCVPAIFDGSTLAKWPGVPQRLKFAAAGVYDVSDEIATHWYVQQFATIVAPSTAPTQTYAIVDF
jgi:hypothetical protein